MASGMSDSIPRDLVHSEFVHISQEHDSYLCRKLYKQWQDLQHCDLTLAVKDGELRAHACVVTAFSPKLKSVLETATHASPATGGVYVQLLFEVGVLRCLLNMMYTGVLSFNTAMLASVLSAARWLQMEEVVQLCQDYREVTGVEGDSSTLTDDLVLCEVDSSDPRLLGISTEGDERTEVVSTGERGCKKGGRKHKPKSSRKRGRPVKVVARSRQPARAKGRSVKQKPQVFLDASQIKQENDGSDTSNTNILPHSSLEDVDKKGTSASPLDIQDAETDDSTKASPVRGGSKRRSAKKGPKDSESQDQLTGKKKRGRQSSPNKSAEVVIKAEKPSPEKDDSEKDSGLLSHSEWVEMQEFPSSDEMEFALGKTDSICCKKCTARFTNQQEYRHHIVNHPTFVCDICSVTYYRKSNLTRHMRTSHFTEHHLTCSTCSFVAKTERGLRTHCKEVHQENKPFKCEHPGCSYTTWKFDFLHRHSEIHSEVKQYICDKCGQGFAQHAGLMSHHRACYQLQQFLCDLCGQSFNHVQSMRAHRRTIHFGEKPYMCKICGNPFSDQRNLKRHMRIHENAYPYECEICKQKYRHSNSLKAHLKKHGDAEFQLHTVGAVQMVLPEGLQVNSHDVSRSLGGDLAVRLTPSQQIVFSQTDSQPRVVVQDSFCAEVEGSQDRTESRFMDHENRIRDVFLLSAKGTQYSKGGVVGDAVFPGQILKSSEGDPNTRAAEVIHTQNFSHTTHTASPKMATPVSDFGSREDITAGASFKPLSSPDSGTTASTTNYNVPNFRTVEGGHAVTVLPDGTHLVTHPQTTVEHETAVPSGLLSTFATLDTQTGVSKAGNSLLPSTTHTVPAQSAHGGDFRTLYTQDSDPDSSVARSEAVSVSCASSSSNTPVDASLSVEKTKTQTQAACESQGGGGSRRNDSVGGSGGGGAHSSYGLETLAEICFSSSL